MGWVEVITVMGLMRECVSVCMQEKGCGRGGKRRLWGKMEKI